MNDTLRKNVKFIYFIALFFSSLSLALITYNAFFSTEKLFSVLETIRTVLLISLIAAIVEFINSIFTSDDSGQPSSDSGQPSSDSGQPSSDSGQPSSDSGQPSSDSGQPSNIKTILSQIQSYLFPFLALYFLIYICATISDSVVQKDAEYMNRIFYGALNISITFIILASLLFLFRIIMEISIPHLYNGAEFLNNIIKNTVLSLIVSSGIILYFGYLAIFKIDWASWKSGILESNILQILPLIVLIAAFYSLGKKFYSKL